VSVSRDRYDALVAEVGEKAALSFDSPMLWNGEQVGWLPGPWVAVASSIGLLRVAPEDVRP
jgi:hypothetical protein